MIIPSIKPKDPRFSSGPCKKYPSFSLNCFSDTHLGRSHKAIKQKELLKTAIMRTHRLLDLPESYKIMITPASDTGAMEMFLWNLLGARGVDVLVWEEFSKHWYIDITQELLLQDIRSHICEYGEITDFKKVDFDNDVVFTWNGTASGVRLPNADCIPIQREGLTICDATSAIFAQSLDFEKLDVVTFSWQKCLGGEAQHGMAILSPRALERLENYIPQWPLPKLFRIKKGYKINYDVFEGDTLNTPSLLAVQDFHYALDWVESIGGLAALRQRSDENANVISQWVERTSYIEYLSKNPLTRSNTSNCLRFCHPEFLALNQEKQDNFCKKYTNLLIQHDVAYDINAYRTAPAGLRIWTGPTIDKEDLYALIPWLDWAWNMLKPEL